MIADHPGADPAVESIETGPEMAYGAGYPESKWVTEQLFRRVAEQTGLRTTSVRVGQVSGDQATGGWNTTEWVAAIARVSQRLGCMPSKDEVGFIPTKLFMSILTSSTQSPSHGLPSTSLRLRYRK